MSANTVTYDSLRADGLATIGQVSCHAFKLGISSDQDGRTTRMRAILDNKV